MTTSGIIFAALVAAFLELDTYFIGMTLFSQPIIAGGIAGFMCGDLRTGIIIGSIVQLIWISPPVGAYVPPSSTAIAFTATVLNAQNIGLHAIADREPLMMFCIIAGAATGYFVGQMDIWNRKLNTQIVHMFEPGILKGRRLYMSGAQATALGAKFIRDFILYAAMFSYGAHLTGKIFATLPVDIFQGLTIALWAVPVIGLAVIFDLYRSKLGANFHGIVFILCYLVLWTYKSINPVFFMLAILTVCAFVIYNFVWNRKEA